MLTRQIDPKALRWTRELSGYSVPELAREVGVSPQHLYRIEWGHRQPSPRLYRALLQTLNVGESDLLIPNVPLPPNG